jgi:hypothetical protein
VKPEAVVSSSHMVSQLYTSKYNTLKYKELVSQPLRFNDRGVLPYAYKH